MSGRLPFDPGRIQVPPRERVRRDDDAPLTPTAVNERVRGCLQRGFPAAITVVGEIGDLSTPRSGHVYLTLKDDTSELRAVVWRSTASKLKFTPEPGMEVLATGNLDLYLPRGAYSLQVRKLEPRGIGALELAFRQLSARLEKEGLFDPARKRPLPRIPTRIGLVTSPHGAAVRDVLQTLARRFPAVEVLVAPVAVQGPHAAAEIATAIRQLNLHAHVLGPLDLLIIGRGGGSLEDLWAFNEEVVARAIAASRLPIVSAVGHEVDITISDLVADVRAATPTAAAELITPHQDDLRVVLRQTHARVLQTIAQRTRLARVRLAAVGRHEVLARPDKWLASLRRAGDDALRCVEAALRGRLQRAAARRGRVEVALARFGAGSTFARLDTRLQRLAFRAARGATANLLRAERRLHTHERRLEDRSPRYRMARAADRLATLRWWLRRLLGEVTRRRRDLLVERYRALESYDPARVLRRGYSITRDAKTGRVVRSIEEIRDRQRIETELADGKFRATADDPRQKSLFED